MSRLRLIRKLLAPACIVGALLFGASGLHAQQYQQPAGSNPSYDEDTAQTPGRVARLAYLSGQVQFAPAGEDDWGSVEINRPMVIGDRLLTGDDGRATLELGDASIRIDHDSAFDFLNLDENNVQVELSQGTLNVAVRSLADGENMEVDTPTVAFVASTPGVYRIDDSPTGTGTMVTVFHGSGVVYGENGVSREVAEGTSYRFNDSALTSVDANSVPQPDDFDRFCETRDANYERYASEQRQYVPQEMIGGDDLYQYGQWNSVPEYGNVWYPTSVPVGWAPYRYGHWAWIDPWGWTWVDDQPWGFAPFHYGRWVYARSRWGWVPGPVNVRPVYAPALVAFLGGSGVSLSIGVGGGGPVGWFPLGPRDVYVPWFHASRRYFTNVNVTNIRNVYVNRTVINNFYSDYRAGRAPAGGRRGYAYRNMPGAVTAVPRNVFADARPVHAAALKLNRSQLARTQVAVRPGVEPHKASLGLRKATARPAVFHGRQPFTRPVVARHQPPPRPVGFAAREKVIASQHGQPLTRAQMQNLRKAQPTATAQNERVKLVPNAVAGRPRPARPAAQTRPRTVTASQPAKPRAGSPAPAVRANAHSAVPARGQPRPPALRPGELPSARFAHPGQRATLPRAPAARPAGEPRSSAPAPGRLPVVRPVQRAPQSQGNRAPQSQPSPVRPQTQQRQDQTRQRAREQSLQQQRQAQAQTQQRERQQAAQQRAREQKAQQQQQIQAQAQQRARDQAIQQQQRVQQQRMQQQRMQQQRAMQMQQQQRAVEMQRQQQTRAREVQRAPQRYSPPPQNRQEHGRNQPPPRKHPPPSSSGNQ